MGTIRIGMYVDKDAAVLTGKSEFGNVVINVDPADLSDEERAELLNHQTSYKSCDYGVSRNIRIGYLTYGTKVGEPVAEANLETLKKLLSWHIKERPAFVAKIEEEKRQEEEKRNLLRQEQEVENNKRKQFDEEMLPAVEAYERGEGERPKWKGSWGGTRELLDRLCNRDKELCDAKKNAQEKQKRNQLDEAVSKLGTESQKERWIAGVMPVGEVVDLIVEDQLKPVYAVMDGAELVSTNETYLVKDCEDCEIETTEKRTLTDEEWATWKKIKSVVPDDVMVDFEKETKTCYSCENEYAVVAECSWDVGVITVCARIVLTLSE
jgi:hypothetical protein